ncbi:BPI fold-containing family B member 4-like [Paroedura picta]|uniref:BPI fold-containing family B member 4-like n=1 Tax=Paroedura picta TaxID=143630 RepID=UPI004056B172
MAGGLAVHLRKSLLTNLVSSGINAAIRTVLPTMICPIFQIWFSLINQELRILNDNVFFGLLGKIHTALSSMPISTGQFSEIDLKDRPFPGAFLQWLLKTAGPVTSQKSS